VRREERQVVVRSRPGVGYARRPAHLLRTDSHGITDQWSRAVVRHLFDLLPLARAIQ